MCSKLPATLIAPFAVLGTVLPCTIKPFLPSFLSWRHSCEKRYQALSCFSVLIAMESWAGPGNKAVSFEGENFYKFHPWLALHKIIIANPTPLTWQWGSPSSWLYVLVLCSSQGLRYTVFVTLCWSYAYQSVHLSLPTCYCFTSLMPPVCQPDDRNLIFC